MNEYLSAGDDPELDAVFDAPPTARGWLTGLAVTTVQLTCGEHVHTYPAISMAIETASGMVNVGVAIQETESADMLRQAVLDACALADATNAVHGLDE